MLMKLTTEGFSRHYSHLSKRQFQILSKMNETENCEMQALHRNFYSNNLSSDESWCLLSMAIFVLVFGTPICTLVAASSSVLAKKECASFINVLIAFYNIALGKNYLLCKVFNLVNFNILWRHQEPILPKQKKKFKRIIFPVFFAIRLCHFIESLFFSIWNKHSSLRAKIGKREKN